MALQQVCLSVQSMEDGQLMARPHFHSFKHISRSRGPHHDEATIMGRGLEDQYMMHLPLSHMRAGWSSWTMVTIRQ